jgi:hypothetical protein
MHNPDMTGFTKFEPTAELVDELKKTWTLYRVNSWIGIHKETGKKIKCGTYYALLQMADSYNRNPF